MPCDKYLGIYMEGIIKIYITNPYKKTFKDNVCIELGISNIILQTIKVGFK
jgi:hypothetical protein